MQLAYREKLTLPFRSTSKFYCKTSTPRPTSGLAVGLRAWVFPTGESLRAWLWDRALVFATGDLNPVCQGPLWPYLRSAAQGYAKKEAKGAFFLVFEKALCLVVDHSSTPSSLISPPI